MWRFVSQIEKKMSKLPVPARPDLDLGLASPRSYDGKYFASLGGQDDNSVVIWETQTGRAVCGSPAAQDSALSVKWLHHRNDRFVTAGNFHLRVWQVDVSIPKVRAGGWLSWMELERAGGGSFRFLQGVRL